MWSQQDTLRPATQPARPECGWGLGPSDRSGRAEGQSRPAPTHPTGLGVTKNSAPSVLGEPRRRGRQRTGGATRPVGPRVTHFRLVFRFQGPRTSQQQNRRAGGRRRGSSPRPPATCGRGGRTGPCAAPPCPARGVGLTAGRALRPTFPADTAPPRETRGGPWPRLHSRKGAAAAEDARPDCAAGGPTREQKAGGPAASSQSRVRWSPAERTWRGTLHGRPGPHTPPPPPLSIILGTGDGLCIVRCACDWLGYGVLRAHSFPSASP